MKKEWIEGEGLKYKLSKDGAYYIVTGFLGDCPHKNVVIPNTYKSLPVQEIGNSAFEDCGYLESVEIGDNVQTIGAWAFEDCENLTSVEIGDNVQTICICAFASCGSLESVEIGDNVQTIGDCAFSSCSNLTSVVIPDSVTSIGKDAFCGCSRLTSIEVSENNAKYKDIDGNLYTKDGKTLIQYAIITLRQYAIGKTETEFTIPDGVEAIGEDAFYGCSNLTSVVMGGSVTSIGDSAFAFCDNLTSVVIGDSVTLIDDSAFSRCDNLTSVVIGDSVTSIGDWAFFGCKNLTSIEVSENNAKYKDIDGNLYTKDGKTLIQYAIGKTETEFTIPDSVTLIDDRAFAYCDNLTSIKASENNATYKDIDGNLYTKDGKKLIQYAIGKTETEFIISDSVTSIGFWAFAFCDNLTSVVIGDSVTLIDEYAFSRCDNLTSVVIGDSVETIGCGAFAHCDNLTSVYYKGTASDWKKILIFDYNDKLSNATRYYYIEKEADVPKDGGKYWHYVDGVPTAW